MQSGFEILVNGVPRTFRDRKELAMDAGRQLKRRDMAAEITVVDVETREWSEIKDVYSSATWNAAPASANSPTPE